MMFKLTVPHMSQNVWKYEWIKREHVQFRWDKEHCGLTASWTPFETGNNGLENVYITINTKRQCIYCVKYTKESEYNTKNASIFRFYKLILIWFHAMMYMYIQIVILFIDKLKLWIQELVLQGILWICDGRGHQNGTMAPLLIKCI